MFVQSISLEVNPTLKEATVKAKTNVCEVCGNRIIYSEGCWRCINPECPNQGCGY